MKNAIILHGIGSGPKDFWFPWTAKSLEKEGYKVWVPQLPQADDPDLKVQLPWILKNGEFNRETVLIGHSSGASLILGILDSLDVKIRMAVLVSGFLTRGGVRPKQAVKAENAYHWEKMKTKTDELVFINAVNDPWGCNDEQGRKMFDHLGGTLIINNEGHMGSEYYKQPYREFPLLLKLIL